VIISQISIQPQSVIVSKLVNWLENDTLAEPVLTTWFIRLDFESKMDEAVDNPELYTI
jgi:hypothetical protein